MDMFRWFSAEELSASAREGGLGATGATAPMLQQYEHVCHTLLDAIVAGNHFFTGSDPADGWQEQLHDSCLHVFIPLVRLLIALLLVKLILLLVDTGRKLVWRIVKLGFYLFMVLVLYQLTNPHHAELREWVLSQGRQVWRWCQAYFRI